MHLLLVRRTILDAGSLLRLGEAKWEHLSDISRVVQSVHAIINSVIRKRRLLNFAFAKLRSLSFPSANEALSFFKNR